ncbi:MAG: type pilus modification protein PilV [Pseudomonadota bacterium]
MVSLAVITTSTLATAFVISQAQVTIRVAVKGHAGRRLAEEMAAWMRAGGARSVPGSSTNLLQRVQNLAAPLDCYRSACTASDAADFYLWHWRRRLATDLPGVRVVLCRDGNAWDSPVFQWPCPSVVDESSPWVLKLGWPDRRGSANFYPSIVLNVGVTP